MKTIHLNPKHLGLFALVSDEDYARVEGVEWTAYKSTATYYGMGHVPKRGTVLLHRFILDAPDGMVVDHKDHNGLNCQRDNLRLATRSQNQANRRSRSGLRGVRWDAKSKKFIALIRCQGKPYRLGAFEDLFEAAESYDAKAIELFGEFAMTNARLAQLGELEFPPRKLKLACGSGDVLVSYADYSRVNCQRWQLSQQWEKGRIARRIYTYVGRRLTHLAEFVMAVPRGSKVVHINRDEMDFRRENLKVIFMPKPVQHAKARMVRFKGVYKRGDRWKALITVESRKRKYLGLFTTEVEAAVAYNKAAIALHGPRAVLNDLSISAEDSLEYHI